MKDLARIPAHHVHQFDLLRMAKSLLIHKMRWNSPELASNLTLATNPAPDSASLAPHTALVLIHAAALNFRDLLTIAHSPVYPTPLEPGNAPCSDGAGKVVATGPESVWKVGDRVALAPNKWRDGPDQRDFKLETAIGATVQGTLRQLAVVADEYLVAAPANASYEEIACLPTAGVTAFRALFGEVADQVDRLRAGDRVLTQGTGGVSLWALQVSLPTWAILL